MSNPLIPGGATYKSRTILEHLGYRAGRAIPFEVLQRVMKIQAIFAKHAIDEETGVGILQSFEHRSITPDDIHLRVDKFANFVQSINSNSRTPFIDSVKNLGLLSKSELEEHAKETGDWTPLLKRSSADAKDAKEASNVSKLDEVGSTAKV